MNKHGKETNIALWGVLGLLVIAGLVAWKFGIFTASTTSVAPPTTTVLPGVPSGVVSCPSDGLTDVYVRYRDGASTTTSYLGSVQAYLLPVSGKTDGLVTLASTSASSTGTMSSATQVTCSKTNPGVYRPVSVNFRSDAGVAGVASVDYGRDVTVADNSLYFREDPPELVGGRITNLQYRVHDDNADSYFNCTSGTAFVTFKNGTTTNTTATDIVTSIDVNYCFASAFTNTTISAAGEYINLRVDVKANASNTNFGQDDLRTFMCVDYTTSTWDEPVVSVGGVQKSDVKSSMQEYDIKAIGSNWEQCFEIGTVSGNVQKSIQYYQRASADVTDSVRIGFFAEGRYKSSRDTDTIKVGIYTDAATQLPVTTSWNQELFIAMD